MNNPALKDYSRIWENGICRDLWYWDWGPVHTRSPALYNMLSREFKLACGENWSKNRKVRAKVDSKDIWEMEAPGDGLLSTLIRFQKTTELFCSVFKKIGVHTCRFHIVFARPHYNAVSVLKTLLYPQCACSNELDACAFSIYRPAKLKPHGSVCPPFWILTVKRSGAQSCLFWWRRRFQIASVSPSTLQNSVFKKHRFQIAPLWRAFSNGSVFGVVVWTTAVSGAKQLRFCLKTD